MMIEVNPLKKTGSVSIRPYFDEKQQNMGLESYGLSLFDGVFHEEQLACVEQNGVSRYITGLNEFAPDVRMIADKDEREAKIKEIRTIVSELEKELASNIIDVKDPEFWNKVQLLRPDNHKFWGKITLRCSNNPVFMDPVKDPYDRIKLYAIEAGGFSIVAKSLDVARTMAVPPKFYLDKHIETMSTKTEFKKIRNKALASLQQLYDKNSKKLLYVCKVVDINSAQYKKTTPNDVMYDNMDRYINGESFEKNKQRAAQHFMSIAELDMETLKLRALVKDATFYKNIATKADGYIYHMESGAMLGRTPADVAEYLKNPLNEQILVDLTKSIERYWNQ
jgi:predicted transcriptional regulator